MGKRGVIKQKSKEHMPFGFKISGNVICVDAEDTLREAASILAKHNIGVVVVKANFRLVGILSERDFIKRLICKDRSPYTTHVKDIMTKKVVTVNLNEGLEKIHRKMRLIKFRHLPIVHNDQVVGILSNRDLMYLRKLKLNT